MVRYVILDKNNFDKKWTKNSYGLLLGDIQINKLNVFLPLECPLDTSLVVSDNILKSINPKWVSKHFSNIYRMLPGNTSVIGLFCVCNQQSFNEANLNVLSILNGLRSNENKLKSDLFEDSYTGKIFLLIDPLSSKLTCKKIDLKDDKNLFKSVDVKCSDVLSEYTSVQSNILVRIDTIMSAEHDKDLILNRLKDSVNPFINDFVTESIMLVNGQQMEDDIELGLHNEFEINKRDNSHGDISGDESMFISNTSKLDLTFIGLNVQTTFDSYESDNENKFETLNRVKIQGRIPGVAFLSLHSTVKETELALKKDLVRSIYSRLELLTEELHITGGEMEVSQILLPQRVKVSLPFCSTFPLSDYKFLSETANDVISRIRYFCRPPGMTDEELDINCIDICIERSEQTSLEDELSEVEPLEDIDLVSNSIDRTGGILYFIGLSALVLCISIVLYYILN